MGLVFAGREFFGATVYDPLIQQEVDAQERLQVLVERVNQLRKIILFQSCAGFFSFISSSVLLTMRILEYNPKNNALLTSFSIFSATLAFYFFLLVYDNYQIYQSTLETRDLFFRNLNNMN